MARLGRLLRRGFAASLTPRAVVVAASACVLLTGCGGPSTKPAAQQLPDPTRTPGAVDARVTPATAAATICRTGFTSSVRPPSSYTGALKRRQLAAGYTWHGDRDPGHYEEDHLVPLELGGSPDDPRNLWPEWNDHPNPAVQNTKDLLENRLHDLVCGGKLALDTAQQAIARNWLAAYRRYGGQQQPTVFVGRYGEQSSSASGD